MTDRYEALRYFCIASETLNFRETAVRLSVSPPVVSRVISDLEAELGESLFKRNTRNIRLTSFGEMFLAKAQSLLDESDALFKLGKQENEMAGTVRITLPRLHHHKEILFDLLTALKPYPDIVIDWQMDSAKLDSVKHRIDMGIRVGTEPDPSFIVRPIISAPHIFVASPELITKLGQPKNIQDLIENYPFTGIYNSQVDKVWDVFLENRVVTPKHIAFISTDIRSEIQAALAGVGVTQVLAYTCQEYIDSGQLQILLPELETPKWTIYLYRPYQSTTSARILKVFDLLTDIVKKWYDISE